jgi:hypothetical protein
VQQPHGQPLNESPCNHYTTASTSTWTLLLEELGQLLPGICQARGVFNHICLMLLLLLLLLAAPCSAWPPIAAAAAAAARAAAARPITKEPPPPGGVGDHHVGQCTRLPGATAAAVKLNNF